MTQYRECDPAHGALPDASASVLVCIGARERVVAAAILRCPEFRAMCQSVPLAS